jgi:hypothetical protein
MVPSDEPEGEIVPDPSEALEFQKVKRDKPKRRGVWMMLMVVLLGAAGGAGWYFYGARMMAGDGDDIPVIHAAEGPVKVRPKTPGGMAIPDRNILVYDRMNGDNPEPRVERLLPMPEMPKTPPAPEPEPMPKAKPEPEPKPVEAPASVEQANQLAKPQKLEPGNVELNKLPAVTVNEDVIPMPPEPLAQPVETVISKLAYQIQIAAVRSHEQAENEWARLKKKHGDLLSGYSLNIVRADLGADKGIFFRLRAGPIAGEDVAQALCQNLSKRKVGCLIVRPGN